MIRRIGFAQSAVATASICAALAAVGSTNWDIAYFPKESEGPFAWNVADNYVRNWSTDSIKLTTGHLPCALEGVAGNDIIDTVNLYDPKLASWPLVVGASETARANGLRVGGSIGGGYKAGTTDTILFDVAGSLTTLSATYIGFWATGTFTPATCSGRMSLTGTGRWTANGDVFVGYGKGTSWLNVDTSATANFGQNLNVGAGWSSTGIVTNKGAITIGQNLRLGSSGTIGQADGTSGYLVNEGTIDVTSDIRLGCDANTISYLENKGTMTAANLLIGDYNGKTTTEVVNRGSLTLSGLLSFNDSGNNSTSIYRHCEGASLVCSAPGASGREFLIIGDNGPARFIVDGGTYTNSNWQDRIFVGYVHGGRGSFEVVNGGVCTFSGPLTCGDGANTYGEVLVDGKDTWLLGVGSLYIGGWLTLWNKPASGKLTVSNGGAIGTARTLLFASCTGSHGDLLVSNGGQISGSSKIAFSTGASSTSAVTLVGTNSRIANCKDLRFAADQETGSVAVTMKGGYISAPSDGSQSVSFGCSGATSTASLTGYGAFYNADNKDASAYMTMFGRITADGDGNDEHTLDFRQMSLFKDDPGNPNAIGSNGWHACNHGVLYFPQSDTIATPTGFCVGDYRGAAEPRLINSVRVSLPGAASGGYFWGNLYATNSVYVPAGLPSGDKSEILSVHRFAYATSRAGLNSSTRIAFSGGSIRFRYPAAQKVAANRIRVYRHTGAAGASWQRVGAANYGADGMTVEVTGISSLYEDWNVGWFAVEAVDAPGMVLVVR